jgi:threonine/homoserine/homoserine lactone efflux protein
MSMTLFAAFLGTCVLLALTPGPNMSLIVANTLAGGLRGGLLTLAGTGTALALLAAVTVIGMSSIMVLMSEWFDVVRWLGAIYLAVLGARQLWSFWKRRTATLPPPTASGGSVYAQGLFVGLSNPKVLLFLGAFFPQFVSPNGADPVLQLAILAAVFTIVLIAVDVAYTIALARARASFTPKWLTRMDGAAGAMLLAGGVVLAMARRPT